MEQVDLHDSSFPLCSNVNVYVFMNAGLRDLNYRTLVTNR